MATVEEILQYMQQLASPQLAEGWDNIGLLVDCSPAGKSAAVSKMLVALEATPAVIKEAKAAGCTLLVTHHPVIFKPLSTLNVHGLPSLLLLAGISAIAAHTNLDAAAGGVSDVLADVLGLSGTEPLPGTGCGRLGRLSAPLTVAQLAAVVGGRLATNGVKYADGGRPVNRVAVVGGSGGDFFKQAAAAGADCLITGEVSHHDALDAKLLGLSVIAAGHYATEWPVVPVLAQKLAARFPAAQVMVTQTGCDPFTYL